MEKNFRKKLKKYCNTLNETGKKFKKNLRCSNLEATS